MSELFGPDLGGAGTYSVEPEPARRIITVTEEEATGLDRATADLALPMDAAAAAAGPGSPVAGALAAFRAVNEQVARDNRGLVERAAAGTRTAIDTYLASHFEMAEQYGPFPPFRPDFAPPPPSLLDRPFDFPPR